MSSLTTTVSGANIFGETNKKSWKISNNHKSYPWEHYTESYLDVVYKNGKQMLEARGDNYQGKGMRKETRNKIGDWGRKKERGDDFGLSSWNDRGPDGGGGGGGGGGGHVLMVVVEVEVVVEVVEVVGLDGCLTRLRYGPRTSTCLKHFNILYY